MTKPFENSSPLPKIGVNTGDCDTHIHHRHGSLLEPDTPGIFVGKDDLSDDSGSFSDNTPMSPDKKDRKSPANIENKLEKESDIVKMLYDKVQDMEKKQMMEKMNMENHLKEEENAKALGL